MSSEVLISSIEGNRQHLDGGSMFGNAPRAVWEKWLTPDASGRIPLSCRAMLVEIGNTKLLCETGIGAFFPPKMAARFGVEQPNEHVLLNNLKAVGLTPDQIDYVILSHLHFDHAGGLLHTFDEIEAGQTGLVFPNAKFIVGEEAWNRAVAPHPRDQASFIPGLTEKLEASGRLLLVPRDRLPEPLATHLEFLHSNGHTPGQLLTVVHGEVKTIVFCGDLVPGLAWTHLPITMGYDRFPELVIDEKASLYDRAVPESWVLFFTHDPGAACAQIRKLDSGKIEPFNIKPTLLKLPI